MIIQSVAGTQLQYTLREVLVPAVPFLSLLQHHYFYLRFFTPARVIKITSRQNMKKRSTLKYENERPRFL